METALLFGRGSFAKRPIVVGDRIEIRPTAYVAFQVDMRVIHARKAMRAFRRFRWLIEHPGELERRQI
jgi:pyruvate/2-oxoglutarate dehydrogenase complex dihydrolipoamide acyltransferase (E2) component